MLIPKLALVEEAFLHENIRVRKDAHGDGCVLVAYLVSSSLTACRASLAAASSEAASVLIYGRMRAGGVCVADVESKTWHNQKGGKVCNSLQQHVHVV